MNWLRRILYFIGICCVGGSAVVPVILGGQGSGSVVEPSTWPSLWHTQPGIVIVAVIGIVLAVLGAVSNFIQISQLFGRRPVDTSDLGNALSNVATRADIDRILAKLDEHRHPSGQSPKDTDAASAERAAATRVLTSNDPRDRLARSDLEELNVDATIDTLLTTARADQKRATTLNAERARNAGALAFARNTTKAIEAYELASELDPDDFWTWIFLSRLMQRIGNLGRGQTAADRALNSARTERERAVALDETGFIRLRRGDIRGALEARKTVEATFRKIAESDPSARNDVGQSLVHIGEMLERQGDLASALAVYREGLDLARQHAAATPAGWQENRSVSACLDRVGDILVRTGDLGKALAAYHEGLDIARGQVAANADDTEALDDLKVSLDRIGDVLVRQGDLAGALQAYNEGLAISRRLDSTDTENGEARRSVSISLERIGDVLEQQGNMDGALAAHREELEIRHGLAFADDSDALAQSELALSLGRVGYLLRIRGDLEGASANCRRSLDIRRKLAAMDATDVDIQRDVSIGLDGVGDVLLDQGHLERALEAYREGLEIRRRLAAAANDDMHQRDISISLNKIGHVLAKQSDLDGALRAYGEALDIRLRLAAIDAADMTSQLSLGWSFDNLGSIHEQAGDTAKALEFFQRAKAQFEKVVAASPDWAQAAKNAKASAENVRRLSPEPTS